MILERNLRQGMDRAESFCFAGLHRKWPSFGSLCGGRMPHLDHTGGRSSGLFVRRKYVLMQLEGTLPTAMATLIQSLPSILFTLLASILVVLTEYVTPITIEQVSDQQTMVFFDIQNDDGEVSLYDEDGTPLDSLYIVDVKNVDTGERCQRSAGGCSLAIPAEGANLMITLTDPTGGEAARRRPLKIMPVPSTSCS